MENGQIAVDRSREVSQSQKSNPRTAVGQVSDRHYVIIVSDGRTSESEGLSLLELAQELKERGCTTAYNLDGGGSSTMYFNGAAMTWMFLYPLIGGTLFYTLIESLVPRINRFAGFRLFYNIHNSGIVALTVGSFLKGILDIAGTNSSYVVLFQAIGWVFIASGLSLITMSVANHKRFNN